EIINIRHLASSSDAGLSLYSQNLAGSQYIWDIGEIINSEVDGDVIQNSLFHDDALVLTFDGVDVVRGGTADDIFNIYDISVVNPSFNGGGGSDLLNLVPVDTALAISLQDESMDVFVRDIE